MEAFPRAAWAAVVALLAGLPAAAPACVEGDVRGEAVTVEKVVGATASEQRADMRILGAGWFRALTIEKDGGLTGDTTVTLELDGEPMISTSFAILKNAWNQIGGMSLSAAVKTEGSRSVMTIWYSPELKFRAVANVRVEINETGVQGLVVRTIMNKPAPHEHIPGTNTQVALPAFK